MAGGADPEESPAPFRIAGLRRLKYSAGGNQIKQNGEYSCPRYFPEREWPQLSLLAEVFVGG
jgi:hypothetical protein